AEEAGFLRRTPDSDDARVNWLSLTAEGSRRLAAVVAKLGPNGISLPRCCARLAPTERRGSTVDGVERLSRHARVRRIDRDDAETLQLGAGRGTSRRRTSPRVRR